MVWREGENGKSVQNDKSPLAKQTFLRQRGEVILPVFRVACRIPLSQVMTSSHTKYFHNSNLRHARRF